MKIKAIEYTTKKPLSFIGEVAGISYGKKDAKAKRAITCFKAGHMSVFEHVSITWRVEGISRACSHQLVRHRLASYCQKSQRYTKLGLKEDWCVMPPEIESNQSAKEMFLLSMNYAADKYQEYLEAGFKPEDARYVLPEATKTDIVITMNLREFESFYKLRSDSHAQWEIRELAFSMKDELCKISEEFKTFCSMLGN